MKKAFKIVAIIIASLFAILLIIPFAFESKIYELVQKKANENLNATVSFTDVDLSLIRNFPHLRVSVEGLKVINKAPFDSVQLAKIENFSIVINVKSLFSDQIEIGQIILDQPQLDVRVLPDGTANYDIAIPDSAQTPQPEADKGKPIHLALSRYAIEKGNIRYDDKTMPMVMEFKNLTHEGSGDFADEIFTLSTQTDADETTFWFDGVTYTNKAKTIIKADLAMDLKNMKFEFKENEIQLNQLFLQANGWVSMPAENIDMDITFGATQTAFKNLLSMVPMEFAKDLNGVEASGNIGLNGYIKGTYNETSMPGIGLQVNIENGHFKYPDLPKSVDDVQLKLAVVADMNNEDNSTIDLDLCHLSIAGNPVDMVLHLKTPESNPYVDFDGNLNIDLNTLKDVIPIGKEEKITGIIQADMMFKGYIKAAESGNIGSLQAEGMLDISQFDYESDSLPYDIFVNKMHLDFNPQFAALSKLDLKVGNTQMTMDGKVTHYLEYAINDDPLVGNLNFYSPSVNVNDFMEAAPSNTSSEPTTTAEGADNTGSSVVVLPRNIDFTLSAKIDQLLYDKAQFADINGNIQLQNGKAIMNQLSLKGLGGSVMLDGWYDGNEGVKPAMDMSIQLQEVDIQTTTKTFVTLNKWATIAQSCDGKISMLLAINTLLDQQMMPINASVDASGKLSTQSVMIKDYAPLIKVAEKTNMDKWKQPLSLRDINVSFTIKNGIITIHPFTFQLDGIPVKMEGEATLDQKINYTIDTDIPFDKFPAGIVNQANSFLGQINAKLGTKLSTGNKINLIARISGDVTNPEVKVTSKALGDQAVQDLKEEVISMVKEEVKEKVTELKDDALEKAKAEKERLVKEAQAQAEKMKSEARAAAGKAKQEAYKQADALANKGGNPLEKMANKKLAEEARKKADQAYEKSIKESDAKTDKLVQDAAKKGDQLIQEADQKGTQQINKINP
jgi:AsmA-like C-terminal region/AsmA family